ncbi:TPA: glycerol-3-phosphate 1-O-acyltransferase PlsY [Candidatus Galligastranaerophilus faecipullorum]|nr:glycerol-3-phosphate 1-O-acyltransferase PlsY [Candidatus Galligastranaerophilus faecipullorum]
MEFILNAFLTFYSMESLKFLAGFCILAYLIGSIPTGYIIVKLKTGQDIRQVGSGSTGATNVKRVLGKKWFFIVMLLDALKGALPVLISKYFLSAGMLLDPYGIYAVACAVFVIVGHSKPVFLGFKGGKSVASGVGTILALSPLAGLIIALIWGAVTYISRYVSLGSIVALVLSPFIMYFLNAPAAYVAYCALAAVYIVYLHRENIKRLIDGNENKVR